MIEKIDDSLFLIRIEDRKTKYFEALWKIEEGITYNSYVLVNKKGEAVVFDTVKHEFKDAFISELERIVNLEKIKYVVSHHAEPDHSGSIKELIKINPNIKILAHPFAKKLLTNVYGIEEEKIVEVKDSDVLEFADERIRFIHTPWLHWPETFMSYLENRGFLLSCDAFGSFSIPDTIFAKDFDRLLPNVKKYYFTVVVKYSNFVVKALEKLKSLEIKKILPSHGYLWDEDTAQKVIKAYEDFAKGKKRNKVVIVYASMYGMLRSIIEKISAMLEKNGIETKVFGITDEHRFEIENLLPEIYDSSCIVIASPTYEASSFPLILNITDLLAKKIPYTKPVILISAYGWADSALYSLEKILSSSKFQIKEKFSFNKEPSNEEVSSISERIIEVVKNETQRIGKES